MLGSIMPKIDDWKMGPSIKRKNNNEIKDIEEVAKFCLYCRR